MPALTIHLQDAYLALLSNTASPTANTTPETSSPTSGSTDLPTSTSTTSASSSIDPHEAPSSSECSTFLKGTVVLTLNRPLKVASLAVTLNGVSHLAISGTNTSSTASGTPSNATSKRFARYSRPQLRVQLFLIEPSPDSNEFTLVAPPSHSGTPSVTILGTGTPAELQLKPNQIAFPFAIPVPNCIPVSVSTPHGGTAYHLTAELTLSNAGSKGSGVLSALLSAAVKAGPQNSSSTLRSSITVPIYRAGFLRRPHPVAELVGQYPERQRYASLVSSASNQDNNASQDDSASVASEADNENAMIPGLVSHSWPGVLESTLSTPFVHLPPKSNIDIQFKASFLRGNSNTGRSNHPSNIATIKSLQVDLYERAIYSVMKTTKNELGMQSPTDQQQVLVGTRDRIISAQGTSKGWPTAAPPSSTATLSIDRTIQFKTPSTIRGPNELYSSRNCNPSTYSRISPDQLNRSERSSTNGACDESTNAEYGAINIEIQHFLRFTILAQMDAADPNRTVERHLGDMPVVIKGVPSDVPDCDGSGLPSYLGSFSTSLLSLAETQHYETSLDNVGASFGAPSSSSRALSGQRLSFAMNSSARQSMLSVVSLSSTVPDDYENDDVFMTVMGFQRARTPPTYEECLGRSSFNASVSERHSVRSFRPCSSPQSSRNSTSRRTSNESAYGRHHDS
ncbi:hypothetical protein BGZ68_008484 [Mortierella alpina]|nr:hypothetical protein BGZ68_008484 [Mortierella alpina]